MNLIMHILKKNEKLNIDNTSLSIDEIQKKLKEEYEEVFIALSNYSKQRSLNNLKEVIRETFDLIQICILILWRSHRQALTFDEPELIKEINIEHKDKLISKRQWIPETGISIEIKE